jgi:hypothetical protein
MAKPPIIIYYNKMRHICGYDGIKNNKMEFPLNLCLSFSLKNILGTNTPYSTPIPAG